MVLSHVPGYSSVIETREARPCLCIYRKAKRLFVSAVSRVEHLVVLASSAVFLKRAYRLKPATILKQSSHRGGASELERSAVVCRENMRYTKTKKREASLFLEYWATCDITFVKYISSQIDDWGHKGLTWRGEISPVTDEKTPMSFVACMRRVLPSKSDSSSCSCIAASLLWLGGAISQGNAQ